MLKKLCTAIGITGYESDIIDLIEDSIRDDNTELYRDSIGNLICRRIGTTAVNKKKRILISAHIDEVGLQVTKINADNKIKFKVFGNIKCYDLYQQRIIFENGIKGVVLAESNDKIEKYNYDNLYMILLRKPIFSLNNGDICSILALKVLLKGL